MTCKNCGHELLLESDYCNKCGAKVIRKRLTIKNLLQHLGETFFNYDNKLFTTIAHLLRKPEAVIDSYVSGVRKRYINPISFFGISLTLTGFVIFIIRKFYKESLDASAIFGNSEMYSDATSQQILADSSNFSLDYSSLIYSAMIPAFALISWVIFLNKRYNYTEHLVLYMYSMSLYSICSGVIGLIVLLLNSSLYLTFGTIMYPIALFYHCFLLKRLFNLSTKALILKTILFLFMFAILFVVASLIFGAIYFLIMYLNGDLQQMIESKKSVSLALSL
ncbi:DUF3667 domain-containing protein [Seonamhaeicola marinus]|uniref:DUF3667 domain-containing protein n=1 Tax=Seonamhaeicola marinus TaxID=1912246 RepID=A0A5D0JC75_9FLAO|nr:DUF3667 domain-containing protein [Seonamhaeicola marinus]TYA92177.1 DUF3667 domain-containing protein [Seonamhaeicola marinus]